MAREYKDSGIEWIGQIPKEWNAIRLKYLCTIQTGNKDTQDATSDGIYPFYVRSPKVEKSETYSFDGEGILMAGDGVGAGRVFHHVFGKYAVHQRVYRLANITGINSSFLFYYISNLFGKEMDRGSAQSTVPSVRLPMLQNFIISAPSFSEQQKIADYLDKVCGEVDEMVALQETMIEELKAYKQSVITEAVTKGLNPNVPMRNSGIDWIGEIPEHWILSKAKFFVDITNGCDPKTEGNIPVYGSGASSFKTCGEYKEGPTVLIGRKGATLHIPHYIEGKYWNVDTAFDVKVKNGFDLRYYYYTAICFDYKYYISQTTLPGMAQSSYNNMIIPVPSIEEQCSIASYLDTKCSEIDSLIALKLAKIEELKEYKKSVIYEYVTGKKEVV